MRAVRLISKPVAPPWNDASKNLARTILTHATMHQYRFWGTPESRSLGTPTAVCDAIYSSAGSFEPGVMQNLRPLLHLLRPDRDTDVYHLLFTPNVRTSRVLEMVFRVKRRPSVHTICSAPVSVDHLRLIFSDEVVAVSESTGRWLRKAGLARVHVIPPGVDDVLVDAGRIEAARASVGALDRPLVVYSGDYEYSQAHPVLLAALPAILSRCPDAVVVFACRHKTKVARGIEQEVAAGLRDSGLADRVRLLNTVEDFHGLLGAADVVVFPAQSLHHKMDIPLTLVEAMLLERPIVVSALPSLLELHAHAAGATVPPGDAEVLANEVCGLLKSPQRRADAGAAGRAFALSRFSAGGMTSAYEDLYESMCR